MKKVIKAIDVAFYGKEYSYSYTDKLISINYFDDASFDLYSYEYDKYEETKELIARFPREAAIIRYVRE